MLDEDKKNSLSSSLVHGVDGVDNGQQLPAKEIDLELDEEDTLSTSSLSALDLKAIVECLERLNEMKNQAGSVMREDCNVFDEEEDKDDEEEEEEQEEDDTLYIDNMMMRQEVIKSPSGAAVDTDLTLTTDVEIMASESCCVRPVPSESDVKVKSRSVTEDALPVLTDPVLRALMDEIAKNIEILLSEPSIPPAVKPDVMEKSHSSGDKLMALMDVEIVASEPSLPPAVKTDVKGKSPSSGDKLMALMDVEIVASEPSLPPAVKSDVKGKSPSSGDKLMALMDVEIVASEPSLPPAVKSDVKGKSHSSGDKLMALMDVEILASEPSIPPPVDPNVKEKSPSEAALTETGVKVKTPTLNAQDWPEIQVNLAKMRRLGCDLKVTTTIKEDHPELKTRNQSIGIAMIPSDQLHPKGADSKQDLPCFEIPSKSNSVSPLFTICCRLLY
jgi:hypothetical protein